MGILILQRHLCCKNWFICPKIKYQKLKSKMTNKNSKIDLQAQNPASARLGCTELKKNRKTFCILLCDFAICILIFDIAVITAYVAENYLCW